MQLLFIACALFLDGIAHWWCHLVGCLLIVLVLFRLHFVFGYMYINYTC